METKHALPVLAGVALLVTGILATSTPGVAGQKVSSITRGGQLYDKWYKVIGAKAPQQSHPAYPADGKYAKKAGSNWRCKECHGWDYKGKDGAYSNGKHYTGIKGIRGMAGADPATIIAVLKGEAHGYADKLSEADFRDLANFISEGQIKMDKYIDRAAKKPKRANKDKGVANYNTMCATCHGVDGKMLNFKTPEKPQYIGTIANANPWEFMHKVRCGQPGTPMISLGALPVKVAVDILAHAQTLPGK